MASDTDSPENDFRWEEVDFCWDFGLSWDRKFTSEMMDNLAEVAEGRGKRDDHFVHLAIELLVKRGGGQPWPNSPSEWQSLKRRVPDANIRVFEEDDFFGSHDLDEQRKALSTPGLVLIPIDDKEFDRLTLIVVQVFPVPTTTRSLTTTVECFQFLYLRPAKPDDDEDQDDRTYKALAVISSRNQFKRCHPSLLECMTIVATLGVSINMAKLFVVKWGDGPPDARCSLWLLGACEYALECHAAGLSLDCLEIRDRIMEARRSETTWRDLILGAVPATKPCWHDFLGRRTKGYVVPLSEQGPSYGLRDLRPVSSDAYVALNFVGALGIDKTTMTTIVARTSMRDLVEVRCVSHYDQAAKCVSITDFSIVSSLALQRRTMDTIPDRDQEVDSDEEDTSGRPSLPADVVVREAYEAGLAVYRQLVESGGRRRTPTIAHHPEAKVEDQDWRWPLYNVVHWDDPNSRAWHDPTVKPRLDADQGYVLIGWMPPRTVMPEVVSETSHLYATSLIVAGVYTRLHTDSSGQTVSRLITPIGSRSTPLSLGLKTTLHRYLQVDQGRFWTIFCHDVPKGYVSPAEFDQIVWERLDDYDTWKTLGYTTVPLLEQPFALRMDRLRHPHAEMARAYFESGEYPEFLLLVRLVSVTDTRVPPRWDFDRIPDTDRSPRILRHPDFRNNLRSWIIEAVGKLSLKDIYDEPWSIPEPAEVFALVEQALGHWQFNNEYKIEPDSHLPDHSLVMAYWYLTQEGNWDAWSCPIGTLEAILQSLGRLPWPYFASQLARIVVERFPPTEEGVELSNPSLTLGSLGLMRVPTNKIHVEVHGIDGHFWSAYDELVFSGRWLATHRTGQGGFATEMVHHIDVWRMDDGAVAQIYPWKDESKQEVSPGFQPGTVQFWSTSAETAVAMLQRWHPDVRFRPELLKHEPMTDMTISSWTLRSEFKEALPDHVTEAPLSDLSTKEEPGRSDSPPLTQLSIEEEVRPESASGSQEAPPRKRQRLAGSASWESAPIPQAEEESGE